MSRKAAKSQHVEPEDETQDFEEPAAEPNDAEEGPGGASISKNEAARRAIEAGHGKPEAATSYIRDRFGIEMTRQHFSAVKSQLKKKRADGDPAPAGRPGRKPRAAEGILAPPSRLNPTGEQADLLAAMEAMKPLVASLGAENVKRIVDLLG